MRQSFHWILTAAICASLLLMSHQPAGALNLVPVPVNKCLNGKLKCVIKKKSCLLNCYAKAANVGGPADPTCLQKCRDKFDGGLVPSKGCFQKLEDKLVCPTTGDTHAIECKVDAFVDDVVGELDFAPSNNQSKCRAGKLKCMSKFDKCMLGLIAKAAKSGTIDNSKIPKCLAILSGSASCFEKLEAKPGCETLDDQLVMRVKDEAFLDDLLSELVNGQIDIHNRRCVTDTSVKCTSPLDCPGATACEYWFGGPLPLGIGGVGICSTYQFSGAITGAANPETGASSGIASVLNRVYIGPDPDQPCPRCDGDPFVNDGLEGGFCNGGARNGLACDGNVVSQGPTFGTTSLDCPPSNGFQIATLSHDLPNTNAGTVAITASAASPNCRASGYTSLKCPCDVCSINQSKPCRTNADCLGGEGTCGGASVGQPTQPNDCVDGNCDIQEPGDDDNGEGACSAGPIDQNCAPPEQHRGCTIPDQLTDCPITGTCLPEFRKCYAGYNGAIGDSIVAEGELDTPVGHCSQPTFASVYCMGPTASSAVNLVYGLPGAARLEVKGLAEDDGTALACPSEFSFTPGTDKGVLDIGWRGIAHDTRVSRQGKVTVASTGCTGATPPCGDCTYSGPVLNPDAVP